MNNKKICLHICCAPCAIEVIESLINQTPFNSPLSHANAGRAGGWEIYGYFYNPNIHPFDEYKKRRDSVISYLNKLGFGYEIADYDAYKYFEKIGNNLKSKERCSLCYDLRLEKSAQRAKELRFNTFSSTLLWNPHKDFEFIANVGRKNAEKYGLNFHFPKLSHDYWKYKDLAKKEEMYIQKYCGCVFSSWENRKKSE